MSDQDQRQKEQSELLSDQDQCQKEQSERLFGQLRDPNFIIQALLVVCTAGLILVGYFQWGTLERTDQTLKDTLAANKLEQRAWISQSATIEEPLEFGPNGVTTVLLFTLKNTGKLPAMDAAVFADIYPIRASEQFYENVYRPDLCVTPPTNAPGALVVAGDSIPWGRSVVPNGDTKIHQTGVHYALVRTNPQWSLDFDPNAGTIKAEHLRLQRFGIGEYAN